MNLGFARMWSFLRRFTTYVMISCIGKMNRILIFFLRIASKTPKKSKAPKQSKTESDSDSISPRNPLEFCNIIAFVNTKSGGKKGELVLEKFKQFLPVENIFDLHNGCPKKG